MTDSMKHVELVTAPRADLALLESLLGHDRWGAFAARLQGARDEVGHRTVWNVNSTAYGGGVAEMLRAIIGYCDALELNVRWAVIPGVPDFFTLTKRLHNHLHGAPGDGGELGDAERDVYERTLAPSADDLCAAVQPGDFVICHDPQSAGLVRRLKQRGARVVWRCHIGHEKFNDVSRAAWDFLAPYVEPADALVFTREAFVPPVFRGNGCDTIHPSIDPLSPKNRPLSEEASRAILTRAGLIAGDVSDRALEDPDIARVRRSADVTRGGGPLDPSARLLVQVSRWDALKDMGGVLAAFAEHIAPRTDASLVLAGPDADSVADDPEGVGVLNDLLEQWRALPAPIRERAHIACLPMSDDVENALIVNALQRHAAVVAQKSLHEGFGLTVCEAMWKTRAVVATRVGGIQDQIDHGEHGLLVDDPADLASFGERVVSLLEDDARAARLAAAARDRVLDRFLITRTLIDYGALFTRLDGATPAEA